MVRDMMGWGVRLLVAVTLLGSVDARAATPENVTYRGTLTDNGAAAASGTYQMRFRLYDAPSGGVLLAEVAAHAVTVTNGTFQDDIGALFGVSHAAGWLQVGVQAPTGGAFDDLPRVRLGAVPYAVRATHADVAEQASSVEWTGVRNAPTPLQGPAGQSVVSMSLNAGHAVCAQGGSAFTVGSTTTFACNGVPGTQGIQGIQGNVGPQGTTGLQGLQGPAGTSTTGLSVGVGDANCPYGGSRFQTGAVITFACNGAPGANGTNGTNGSPGTNGTNGTNGQSVTTLTLSAGHPVCANGGASFTVGGNTTYACNGATGPNGANGTNGTNGTPGESVTLTSLAVGDANCPNGGTRLTVGGTNTYACNGAAGAGGTVLTAFATSAATTALTATCGAYGGALPLTVSINAPGPGRIVVTGFMSVDFDHVLNVADRAQIGVGESTTDCGTAYDRLYLDVPAAEAAFTFREYSGMTRRVVDVGSAGTRTFYLNGLSISGTASADYMYWGTLTAQFFPD